MYDPRTLLMCQVADSGATLNTNQLFIFEATNVMFKGLADLLSFVEKFSSVFGQVDRLHSLHLALENLCQSKTTSNSTVDANNQSTDGTIALRHADVVTPARVTLAGDVSVSVSPNTPLLVTGPNASGKSAIYRVIAGLWQIGNDVSAGGAGSVVRCVQDCKCLHFCVFCLPASVCLGIYLLRCW